MNNATLSEHFSLLSKLMDIHGENSFKSRTYSIAAFHIEKLEEQLKDIERNKIQYTNGIGASVATKIIELLDTGNLQILQKYLAETPSGVIEMLNIKGIGPKKIHTIWKEMGIASVGELEYACNENRLTRYKGFGEKTQQNVLASIQFYQQHIGHFLYAQIDVVFPSIHQYLEKLFGKEKVLITGDFRRQWLTIKELEFVIDERNEIIKPKFLSAYPPELLEETETTLLYKLNNGLRLRLYTGEKNIYKKQFVTSASKEFIDSFFTVYDQNLFDTETFDSEEEIFAKARVPYILPYLREKESILAKAIKKDLPEIIKETDIKGIIHNHSNWSDGNNTIEEMAKHIKSMGYEYFVISDHSKTAAYANGLSEERILQQHVYINELNNKLKPFRIFKSIESDILNDGSLDYSSEVLASFDLVIASVHSNLYMNETKAMTRLLNAIKNPYTTILGHPTGRLLLSRNGYPVKHKEIIDACATYNVAIEINANPHRLDLDWNWIEYAMSKNVLLSINPDAHSIEGISDTRYGVLAAQKGGLTAQYNLSSFTLMQFEEYLMKKKKSQSLTRNI